MAVQLTSPPAVPAPLRFGVLLFAVAAAADVLTHLVAAPPALQLAAHVATFAGMVGTLAGIVSAGLRRSPQPSRTLSTEQQEEADAIR